MSKPEQYIQYIIKQLESGLTEKSQIFTNFHKNYKKKEWTFNQAWKTANERYSKQQQEINEAIAKERKQIAIEAAKNGLQSKHERIFNLQKQLIECYKDLDEGKTNDFLITNDKKPQEYRRKMTQAEKNQTRKTAKDLSSEISKLSADYKEHNEQKKNGISIVTPDTLKEMFGFGE